MAIKSSSVNRAVKHGGKKKSNGQQSAASDQIISRVHELAWAGKHAEAIELASQTLSMSGLKPDLQMDLLDLRAESYLALLNVDAAEKDVKQMERIAKLENKPAFKARALIRKTHLRTWQQREEDRKRTGMSALKLARQSKNKYLEAESLFWLTFARRDKGALELAQQAADLYLSLNNASRAGWALNIVARRNFNLGRNEEARQIARTAPPSYLM